MANTHMGLPISSPLEVSTGAGNTPVSETSPKSTSSTESNKTVEESQKDSQTFQSSESQSEQEFQQTSDPSKKPPSSAVVSLKDPGISGLPFKKGDSVIKPNDSGDNVKWIQDFLQSLPEVQKQENFLADFGKGYSLTDSSHYGKYELETRKHIRDYQNKNYSRIKKYSQLSDADFDVEMKSGIISFATVSVILEDKGEYDTVQEGKDKVDSIPEKIENVIPDPPKAANVPECTFFVKTKNSDHRLALRKSPAYVKVSKEAYEDEDKKGERIAMMPNETLLKIIKPHVGYNCEWHRVEVVDPDPIWDSVKDIQKNQELFSYAEFIYPLSKTTPLPAVNCLDCKEIVTGSERKTPFPDWTKMTSCDIFYDSETAMYYIVVDSANEGITKEELPVVKKQAMFEGISNILDFYDKENGRDQILRIIDVIGDNATEEQDYFLEERPNSRLKFLVGLPKKYFDPIPRRQEFFDNVPTLGGIMPKEWRTIVFNYGEFKSGIDIVVKRFEEYAVEIDKWDGQVLNYDIRDEAKKLQSFMPIFEKFLGWNEVVAKDDSQFEIGFSGPCFRLLYVLNKRETVFVPLRVGIECFKNSEPVVFERTMGYVFYLLEMVKDIKKEKRRWISFINSYTCPLARIIPSGGRTKEDKNLEKKLNDSSVKTTTEKIKEDKKIEDVKQKMIANRGYSDYVGSPLFQCETLTSLGGVGSIRNLNDLYKKVLNKINIKDIAIFVASCLATGLTPAELNAMACDYVLKSLKYDQLVKIVEMLDNASVVRFYNALSQLRTDKKFANVDPAISFRSALLGGVSKSEICKTINIYDPTLMVEFLRKLTTPLRKFEKFRRSQKPLTISLKNYLPTEDTLREIRENLENAIREAISQSLFALVKVLLETLCSACSRNKSPLDDRGRTFGDDNLNDHFKNSNIDPKDLDLDDFDIPRDCEDIKDFFDDLSNIMTPSELCSLLDGAASNDILNIIKNLLSNKYPCLSNYLNDTYKIKKLFEKLGSLMDPSLCRDINNQIGPIPVNLCEEKENIKRSLLENRLSKELIEEQIQKEKERNKELLKQMVQLSDDNALSNFIPPIAKNNCDKTGVNTAIENSIVPSDPPSIQKLNDQVVDVMFDPIEESFNNDLKGFVNGLFVNEVKNVSSDVYKEIYNIERKKIGDKDNALTDSDCQKRLNNPEYGNVNVKVLPELQKNLSVDENFISVPGTFLDYDYKLALESEEFNELLNKIKNPPANIISNTMGAAINGIIQDASNKAMKGFITTNTMGAAINGIIQDAANKAIKDMCPDGNISGEGSGKSLDVNISGEGSGKSLINSSPLSRDTLIRYSFLPYGGNPENIKDSYIFNLNDIELGEQIYFTDSINIEDDIKDFIINSCKLKNDVSVNQSVLANIMYNTWLNNLTVTSKKKVLNNNKFFDYLKNDVFSEMMITLMKKFAWQTSVSPLFSSNILENIDFVPDTEIQINCNSKENRSLLDIDSSKSKVKENYEKESNRCPDKLDKILSKMSPMDRTGMSGAIDVYVKLFVIENFLRGMFVFSDFKVNDMFGDGLIVRYLSKRVQDEIKSQSGDYYQLILQSCKDSVETRGKGLVDPYSTNLESDIGNGVDEVIDESDPKWSSGEKALEFLIKENIKNFSSVFDGILGYEKSEDVYRYFLDKWYNPNYFDLNFDGKFYEDYVKNILKPGDRGDFIVERYIRVCGEREEDRKVYSINDSIPKNQKFVYGIRLSYIFSSKVNFEKNEMFDLNVDPIICDREKSFICKGIKDKITHNNLEVNFKIETKNYISPIVSVEEEDYRSEKLQDQKLKDIIESLKDKMIRDKTYRTLFEFVFPLQRILSLTCIYNIMATSLLIPGIEQKFGMTKSLLKNLISILLPPDGDWWKRKNSPSNEDLRNKYMNNITTNGPDPKFASMAAQTIPILIKGLAEKHDSCYSTMKKIWDRDPDLLMGGLSWGSVPQMMPINIFPLIGFGPPLMPFGMAALSMPLLSGERNHEDKISQKKKDENVKKCKGENK